MRELQLDNDHLIEGKIQIREAPAGTYLIKEESNKVTIAINKTIRSINKYILGYRFSVRHFWYVDSIPEDGGRHRGGAHVLGAPRGNGRRFGGANR